MITKTISLPCPNAPESRLAVNLDIDADTGSRRIRFVDYEDGIEKSFDADDLKSLSAFFVTIRETGRAMMSGIQFN